MPVAAVDAPSAGPQRRPARRVLVPFPADAPKEPDRIKMREEIDRMHGDVKRFKERTDEIKAKLGTREEDPEKQKLLGEKKALIEQRAEVDNKMSEAIKSRNTVQSRLKEFRDATRSTEREVRELNKELRDYKSVEAVDAKIKALELKMETGGTSSVKGEKRVMQEIKQLQAQRSKVAALDKKLCDIQAKHRNVEDVGGDQRELQAEIDVLREQSTELREQIAAKDELIRGRNDQGRMQALRDEKAGLHEKIGAIYAKMDVMRAKFAEEKKVYDEFRAEHRKKEDEAWEKLRTEQAAERAAREEQKRAKDLEVAAVKRLNPHEEEIAMTETLIQYLEQKSKVSQQDEKRVQERKHFDASAAAGAKGFAVMKKGGGDDTMDFGLKKKKAAPKPKPAPKDGAKDEQAPKAKEIRHQYTKFDAFEKVGVKIPMRTDEVKEAITALKARQEHFRSFIKSEKEAIAEEKAAQEKEAAEKAEKEAAEKAEAAAAAAKDEEEGSPKTSPAAKPEEADE